MKYKIGDIIKVPEAKDYGYVAKEDNKHFWVYWFNDLDQKGTGYHSKYSKEKDYVFDIVASQDQ